MKKKAGQLILSLIISAGFLAWAFWNTNWSSVAADMGEVKWFWLGPSVLLMLLHFYLRSLRWRYLLPDLKERQASTLQLFDAIAIGNFATYILPFRVGEFIRPYVLTLWAPYGFGAAFVSVVIERFFDLSAVLLTLAIIAPFLPSLPPLILKAAISLGVVAVGILIFLGLLCAAPGLVKKLLFDTAEKMLPKKIATPIVKFGNDLLQGALTIRTLKRMAIIIFYTAIIWISCYMQAYGFLLMFPGPVTVLASITVAVFTALAVALPSAPGFVGVYQAGCALAFSLFAYPDSLAVTYSIITHLFFYTMLISLGVFALSRNDLKLSQLRKVAMSQKEA